MTVVVVFAAVVAVVDIAEAGCSIVLAVVEFAGDNDTRGYAGTCVRYFQRENIFLF